MQHAPVSNARSIEAVPRRKWALGSLLAVGSAAAVLGIGALAGGPGNAWARGGDGSPSPGVHAAWGGAPGLPGAPFLGGKHLDRLLDKVDATPAQRDQIKPITEKAAADLKALRDEGRTLHEQGLQLWAQPVLDANAAEQLRQRTLAHHDKVSKRVLQAMLDVGQVLTPEQRAKLAEIVKKRHDRHERLRHLHPRHGGPGQGASAPAPAPAGS